MKEMPATTTGVGGDVGVEDLTIRLENLEQTVEGLDAQNIGRVGVRVDECDWEKIIKRLGHVHDVGTSFLLKEKTMEKL